MTEKTNPEDDLFEQALLKAAGLERAAFLDGACQNQPELRGRLEMMLEGHLNAGGFLDTLPKRMTHHGTIVLEENMAPERPGSRIGAYKLLQILGEGGCGVVYMAEQESPVRRRVALKVIKLGMDTRTVMPASKPSAKPWR